ncbi:qcr9 subunit 9 of the ubiquinol cytochrome-c reductase complex [Coniosporium apollinis]|uniref:Complex III subunit 9 n=2 Tax=Coniosporium TaxID=2810619 RepID=A0ABQ9NJ20_9PEZI|nr:qcr9 subunit 9 of the ubiquinol cytochrome-c reductase complex [Cladosporium sp. JES 115]KAJ9659020.1 qcr9 subunit 9 of the ubiquinol cytochrome-c reductase complex [Coniosporium apollinis]
MAGVCFEKLPKIAQKLTTRIADSIRNLQARLPPQSATKLDPANASLSTLIRRNTVFLGTIFLGAFATQIAFDTAADRIWDTINRGRQWKDIKQRYIQHDDDE